MLRPLPVLIALLAVAACAQDLPDGVGKDTTQKVCTFCHGLEQFSSVRKSADDWDRTITAMTTDKGISIPDADYTKVLDYLSACLGPATSKVNVNKAAPCELIRVLSVTPAQAGAIVASRTKNGDFKDFEGLAKVEGLDAGALTAKKDKIAF